MEKYNGWTNRETWLVSLWGYIDLMTETAKDGGHTADAEWCKEFFEQLTDESDPMSDGIVGDLYAGALARIDWYEVAQHVNDALV